MRAAALTATALLAACAATPPNETVVVLPAADGHVGGVVVQRGDNRQVLDKPYAANRAGEATTLSAAEVNQSFGPTLSSLPARPENFLLHFITGTDELTPDSKAQLSKILAAMRERPQPDVVVTGHTDTVGDPIANDRLSLQRAERVKAYLVDIGIPAGRIRTAGRGQRELLVPTGRNVEEPRNRRVEINVR